MGASADKKPSLPKQRAMLSHVITQILKADSFLNACPTLHPNLSFLSVLTKDLRKDKSEFPVQPFLWDRRRWHWTRCLLLLSAKQLLALCTF